jgi:hypothetical protein
MKNLCPAENSRTSTVQGQEGEPEPLNHGLKNQKDEEGKRAYKRQDSQ